MSKKRTMMAQLNNLSTYQSIFKQMVSIAQNTFVLDIPAENIWIPYINDVVLNKTSIAFFIDDVMGLLALPYQLIGDRDVYSRPVHIRAYGANGYSSRILSPDDYVILYDNTDRRSIIPDIRQYAQRMAQTLRAADININQQRTPRIIKGSQTQAQTLKALYDEVDRNEDVIYLYKDIDFDDVNTVLAPSPYVADKLDEHADRIWNDFCRLVGISNIQEHKKERLISSEVQALQAGSIASRWSRYIPRAEAIDGINEKFAGYLDGIASVRYYDDVPGTDNNDGDIYEGYITEEAGNE